MYIRCPYYKQSTSFSCWPVSVKMLLDFWENEPEFTEARLIKDLHAIPKVGTDNHIIIDYLLKYSYKVYYSTKGSVETIQKFLDLWLPMLVNYKNLLSWNGHFAVIIWYDDKVFYLNDPVYWESYRVVKKTFMENWTNGSWDLISWFLVPIKEPYFRFYELGDLEKWFIWI